MKTAIVMEGGATRGMFTCGVIDVFMENGIDFDAGAGVSAGAAFGANIKSRQIGRPIRYNKKYCRDKRMGSIYSFLKTGDVFDVEFAYHELPYKLDVFDVETFKNNPMDFYIVATNVETGQAEYYLCKDGGEIDVEWMRASASMPLVSNIVDINGIKLLDGGCSDSVPIDFMKQLGYKRIVVVLTQPKGYRKKKNRMMPLIRMIYRKYPGIVEALETRHLRYNRTYSYLENDAEKDNIFVIQPPHPLKISSISSDPNELERVYQIGREEALKHLENVKAYLNK